MNIWLAFYLIGCILSFIIAAIELIKTHETNTNKQYGLLPVVIMLSWVVVCVWVYNYFDDHYMNIKRK